MTSSVRSRRERDSGRTALGLGPLPLTRIDPDRLAWPALAVAVIASGLLLFHLTRGSTFWVDEWSFITERRGSSASTFLSPYQGHLSIVPVAIYQLMFSAFGIASYTPYRVLVIAFSLVVAVLVFCYARPRVGDLCALLLATLMLFLGPGWQNTMWAFQVAWLIVASAGIGALMLLDRRELRADIAACVLVLIAICSTSVGVAFAVGTAVDVGLIRRRWRDAWIVAIPLGLYVIWVAHYHPTPIAFKAITAVPSNVAQAAASALSALVGLSGVVPFNQNGTLLTYGVPLLVLGSAFAGWLAVRGRFSARTISLLVILATFTAMVTLVRAGLDSLVSSRYLYFYCLLAALVLAELARGTRPSLPVQVALCGVCCLAILSNIGPLRAFGAYMRQSGAQTRGALTVLDLDRATTPPGTLARIALYPYVRLTAGAYFSAERALGTPAYSVSELLRADAVAQSAADGQLENDGTITLSPITSSTDTSATPLTVDTVTTGTASAAGGCARLVPLASMPTGTTGTLVLTVPAGDSSVSIDAGRAPVSISYRRFSQTFTNLGEVQIAGSGLVRIHSDATIQPWFLRLASIAPVRACPVAP